MSSLITLAAQACRKNRIIIQHDHYMSQIYPKLILAVNEYRWNDVLYYACKYNFPSYIDQAMEEADDFSFGAKGAYRGGHLDLFNRMIKRVPMIIQREYIGAGKHGYWDCVDRLESLGHTEYAFYERCSGPDLNLVLQSMPDNVTHRANGISFACKYGRLNTVKYLLSILNFGPNSANYDVLIEAIKRTSGSSSSNRIDILRLLCEIPGGIDELHSGFPNACKRGNMDIILWIMEQDHILQHRNGFVEACRSGHLDIIRLLVPHITPNCYNTGFILACKSNNPAAVSFFLNMPSTIEDKLKFWKITDGTDNRINIAGGLLSACAHGHIDIVHLLATHLRSMSADPHFAFNQGLSTACSNGRLDICQYMIRLGPMNLDICFDHMCLRYRSSKHKYNCSPIVDLLLQSGLEPIPTVEQLNQGFVHICDQHYTGPVAGKKSTLKFLSKLFQLGCTKYADGLYFASGYIREYGGSLDSIDLINNIASSMRSSMD